MKRTNRRGRGAVVYILRCADGTLYTGAAKDLARRVAEHNRGAGAKYTRGRLPVSPVYAEPCRDFPAALRRESRIKRLSRKRKLALVFRATAREVSFASP